MTHLVHDVPEIVLSLIKVKNIFVLIAILYLVKSLFELDFECSCEPEIAKHEVGFILLPILIICLVVYLFESNIQNVTKCQFCNVLLYIISIACTAASFWFSAVLLEGDWWLCVFTKNVTEHQRISCKDPRNFTTEEKMINALYKNDSFFWGLVVITASLLLWCFIPRLARCCNNKCFPPFYAKFYEDSLREAVEKHLKEELTKIAEESAKRLCLIPLEMIRGDPRLIFRDGQNHEDEIEEAWRTISSPDLYAQAVAAGELAEAATAGRGERKEGGRRRTAGEQERRRGGEEERLLP
ncbi:hypothetical protein AALO_G00046530 [Alosa alosa]|uniref:Uncharacterized protein n=1 Tax=Alosa alosa TaxID=278164 RepID=A0AAV6HE95_9TELE|nr:hypothetical protein AALO_G00046530 [Alosa alosa]